MKAGTKFLIGAAVIVAAVSWLIVEGVRETGTYYLTPTELAQKAASDSSFYGLGVRVGGAKVVPGSVTRDVGAQEIDFRISDGHQEYAVNYRGIVPDTFTGADDIEVIVDGSLGRDGVIRATEVLAKCGSRYEAAAEDARRQA
jgi:cytochrome c-type biogenesis protein CcmE